MGRKIKNRNNQLKLAVIGLGYVGLPLAIELNKKFEFVIGFDLSNIIERYLKNIYDVDTVSQYDFGKQDIYFTAKADDLIDVDVFFITVPTDVDANKQPVLMPLISATLTIVNVIKKSAKKPIVCYESTVYPGATEELEKYFSDNSLYRNIDYYLAYSPERINPGDKEHTLTTTTKIVASDNEEAMNTIRDIYDSIMDMNGDVITTHSIVAAEATKMYENCQRDVLIALANEFTQELRDEYHISFDEVDRLASTRWNYFNIKPGLVGGHCIGVDPYYMISKMKSKNKNANMLISARNTNENMVNWLAKDIVSNIMLLNKKTIKIGYCGLTYKANCNDVRNSKSIELANKIAELLDNYRINYNILYNDPNLTQCVFKLSDLNDFKNLDVLIITVKHKEYCKLNKTFEKMFINEESLFIDLPTACLDGENSTNRYINYW